jgi:hypothetical protein
MIELPFQKYLKIILKLLIITGAQESSGTYSRRGGVQHNKRISAQLDILQHS